MEPDDSQLSDILKDARIPDSQDIGVNLTQNLSFDTVQKMIDGVFTPIFSQGTEDSLEKDILKTPGISTIYNGILGNGEETKKRTPKISDAFEPDLNTSGDVFDSDKSEDGLMNDESYLSNTTLSQVVLDSQKYEYLRVRTEEEQQLVIEKRARERFIRKSMKIAEETALSYENDGSRELSETMTQKVTQMDFTETNVPFDGNDESSNLAVRVQSDMNLNEDCEKWMEIDVLKQKVAKSSDMAFAISSEHEKYLWTKMGCLVPIQVKWKLDKRHFNSNLSLRIRFVKYDKKENVEYAIRNPRSDVMKCRSHTEREQHFPFDSFFYIRNSEHEFSYSAEKGSTFTLIMYPGAVQANFDIIFMCQEKCLDLDDRRKTMCLAVFLDDENGNEILHAYIKQVRIVAYPRRDWKNFCEREDAKQKDFRFPELPAYKKASLESINIKQEVNLENMFNVTNTTAQMEPSTSYSSPSNSNNRKRFLNECDSPNNDYTMMHRTPPVTGYASRLHGCVPPIETEHENCQSPSMKRSRCTNYSFRTLTLSTAEYTKVVEFLAREAKVPRYTWVPTQVVSHILPTEGLERFLTAIKAGHDSVLFNANGIYTMGDMIREFEKHNDIFERIGIDSSKLSKYYEAFLSFYRIQEAMKLPK